jgi:hypothetical protein
VFREGSVRAWGKPEGGWGGEREVRARGYSLWEREESVQVDDKEGWEGRTVIILHMITACRVWVHTYVSGN